jgi:fucose permease
MPLVAPRFRGLYSVLFSVFALFGISMTVFGATLPKILADFSWSYGAAGAIMAASAAAYFAASSLGGILIRGLGAKATTAAGLGLSALGLALFASLPSPALNLAFSALIGAGQGLIEPAVNWSTLRMDEGGSGRAMNLMHGSFAIGAVAGPLVIGLLIGTGLPWTILYRATAALFLALALVVLALPFQLLGSPGSSEAGGRGAARRGLARRPSYWLGFLTLLLYVGAELGFSNWIAEYFVRVFGAEPAKAALMVSLFWIGLLAGRFGAPVLYRGKRQEVLLVLSSLLLVLAIGALNALGYLPGAGGAAAAWAGPLLTFLAGLGCSVVYPIVISLAGTSSPDAQAEAVSFAVAGGGLGLFAFPFLMSWISQAWGIRTGFLSYAIVAALTALACAALARAAGAERARRAGG